MKYENRREAEAHAGALRIALAQTQGDAIECLEAAVGCLARAMGPQAEQTYRQELSRARGMTAEKIDAAERGRAEWRAELATLDALIETMPADEGGEWAAF